MMNRRELLASMGFLAPFRALAAVAKPVRIKAIKPSTLLYPSRERLRRWQWRRAV